MITLIEGRIGSGKSYFAVRDILYQYFTLDLDKVQWIPRSDIDVEIYSNVDGFWVVKSLDEEIKKAGGLEIFFSESYQKKFTKLKRHVYVIDEAQKSTLFHKKFYNAEVFYVFEFSRHLGIDFFLITQDLWKLSPGLVNLPEIHIKVQRRSLAVFRNSFTYMYMSDRDVLKKMSLKKDPRVFAAYRSQRVAVRDTLKSFSRRYILIFGLLFCSVAGGFYMFTKSFFWTMERSSKNKKVVNHVEKVEKKMLAVVGDYVFYNVGGKVLKEKK